MHHKKKKAYAWCSQQIVPPFNFFFGASTLDAMTFLSISQLKTQGISFNNDDSLLDAKTGDI
jgi:hypothetical protein